MPNENVQEQMTKNSPHSVESVQEYQRIHYIAKSAQGQMPENLPHNAEGVQEQIPENLRIYHTTRRCSRTPENISHAESAQGQMPKNSPQRQRCSRTNTREFIVVLKVSKNKYRRIHHTMPKVFKNKHQRIYHSAESTKRQTPENLLHNDEDIKNKHKNSS
ncbi:24658_t:CDS:2, partial [Gigaspora rosea]